MKIIQNLLTKAYKQHRGQFFTVKLFNIKVGIMRFAEVLWRGTSTLHGEVHEDDIMNT